MVSQQEVVSVPPADAQSNRDEYRTEDYKGDDGYLEVIRPVIQR